ncbi:MAG: electron transfer flavoprotein subunit beta/FixA family protein [Defluviitaleaceae bacterium]|nr:electron transfer flavoprotein subunit beta/FixA family protein [Defluviitaleaceae bacterium]MCL2835523.1 electron transfer flavoprotein subunit beta/FixA family protein [Defluviitaleaceae bacterium]
MKIIVCAKQVPDTNEVKIDPVKGTLIREGVPSILNPDDANALEAALSLKDTYGGEVHVISMGPGQAKYMLRECLAMGADDAVLLSSRVFGGADTYVTANTVAEGIKKIGGFDIIFAGRQAIDGDTAQVGPQIAGRLGLPVVTYVQAIREVKEKSVIVERQMEDGYEVIEIPLPCVLTAVKELNSPRYMTLMGIEDAYAREITVWDEKDLNIEPEKCGLKASPTKVWKSFTPPPKGKGQMLGGSAGDAAAALIDALNHKNMLKKEG